MGRDLLQQTIQFLEYELPNYVQNSERYSIATCFESNGQTEKALDALQLQVDRGFINDWWWMKISSIFKPLHDNPRFKEILDQIEREVENQRNNLATGRNE